MGWPVVLVDKGGIPVMYAANGLGVPITIADGNRLGVPVTVVFKGGIPVTVEGAGGAGGDGAARLFAPGPAPAGSHWEFVTSQGERVTAATNRSPVEPVVATVPNGA